MEYPIKKETKNKKQKKQKTKNKKKKPENCIIAHLVQDAKFPSFFG
jgi:hypothetical protein